MDAHGTGRRRLTTVSILFFCLLLTSLAAVSAEQTDRTLSPYFFVHSDDPNVDRLPLKATHVAIRIAGVIADVTVTQRYKNEGRRTIEAEYVFPGSTRAAVHGLTMTIGERRVIAQIREKQQARTEYQAAKTAGKSAALLEQHRPNVFKMNVANILPGDEIAVELRYTELIVPIDGMYELVFPTVVGPRYTTKTEGDATAPDRWQQNPYLRQGEPPTSDLRLLASVASGIPLKEVASPSHRVQGRFADARHATIELDERLAGNRDFILQYRLGGDAVESGVLLFEDGEQKYFVAMIEPPKRVTAAQVPARDYVFVLDVSGSMNGFPLDVAKTLMRNLLGSLRPDDTFNVLLFAGASSVYSNAPVAATPANIAQAIHFVDRQEGGGATELLPALERALALPGGAEVSRSIVVVTDGYVDVEAETFALIRRNLGKANLFTFGIGSSVNRHLIEGMARAGEGEPFVVTDANQAPARAEELRRYIESPVLTKAQLSAEGIELYDVEPAGIPDVLAARPVVVFGKWRGERKGQLMLRGIGGSGPYEQRFDLRSVASNSENRALRHLWARHRIARLTDDQRVSNDPARIQEITRLGLEYSLLTQYTSFLAVDHVVRSRDPGENVAVKQPLPLPQGVRDLAVGGEVPTTPEPEMLVLIGIAGAMAAWARRRRARAQS